MDDKDPDIRSQNSALRRGLVLGLTMAEIMILILFTLLLALAAALGTKNDAIRKRDQRIEQLTILEQQIGKLLPDSPKGITVEDIIQHIERQQHQIDALKTEVDRLKPFESSGTVLQNIIRQIRRDSGESVTPQQIIEAFRGLSTLRNENGNLRGQIAQLTNQIKATGRGNEFPSCWVTPAGGTESIFELLVTGDGIKIKDRDLPHRTQEKAELPLSTIQYDSELPLEEFRSAVRNLYRWSVDHQCRFYVIIFSSVADAPIELLNAVNGYFYPDSRIQYRPGGI